MVVERKLELATEASISAPSLVDSGCEVSPIRACLSFDTLGTVRPIECPRMPTFLNGNATAKMGRFNLRENDGKRYRKRWKEKNDED